MFKKILIANRGEIALRIIRACRELGILTVAVYSKADEDSLHVRFADEAVCIGPPPSNLSYLNIPQIISAAEITNADAIHPGYGFLAENPGFAEVCESCGIHFLGPPASVIAAMGDKAYAKRTMREAGIPVIPGSDGVFSNPSRANKVADEIGYPVIIKAAAGGGGKGMRIVHEPERFEDAFLTAMAEANSAFGKSDVYIEKYIVNPRHVEIQILADNYGTVIHLGERDCTIQRRYQKLIEESPSPAVDGDLRKKLGEAAIKGAVSVGYRSAGTVEFLVDDEGRFYFMEVNTRIQVEHPVTEMVIGLDIIKEQINLAAGAKFPKWMKKINPRGHAIECRINAEDPSNHFLPSPGRITTFHIPGGPEIRVDTHAYSGYVMPSNYDSLIAKLIAHGRDRTEALRRMERSLEEFIVEGVKTTIPFHQQLISTEEFQKGTYTTSFLEDFKYSPEYEVS
ncbi:MAG: acetyl-CoA carboxylase biotin carboxylase subunit [Fidelibacterota bacterium]